MTPADLSREAIPVAEFADDFVLAREHLLPIRPDLAGNLNPEIGGMLRGGIDLRPRNQRFGRNAADIQACTAEKRLLDQSRFESALSGTNRCDIPAGTGADHTHIKLFHGSSLPDVLSTETYRQDSTFFSAFKPETNG